MGRGREGREAGAHGCAAVDARVLGPRQAGVVAVDLVGEETVRLENQIFRHVLAQDGHLVQHVLCRLGVVYDFAPGVEDGLAARRQPLFLELSLESLVVRVALADLIGAFQSLEDALAHTISRVKRSTHVLDEVGAEDHTAEEIDEIFLDRLVHLVVALGAGTEKRRNVFEGGLELVKKVVGVDLAKDMCIVVVSRLVLTD